MIFTITVPDSFATRFQDAIAVRNRYSTKDGTKVEFAKAKLVEFMRTTVRDYEGDIAATAAMATIAQQVDAVTIT